MKNKINVKHKVKFVLFLTLLITQLLTIGIVLVNYLFFTNTLANNPKWQVSKTQLYNPGYDGNSFKYFLPALAKNSLNLSSWRGYHEVSSTEKFTWKEFSLNFLPSNQSYLYVIFDQNDEYFSALRISYSPLHTTALIKARYTGEFIEQTPIENISINGEGWQKLAFKKDSSKNKNIQIFYNDKEIATYNYASESAESIIAFRAGQNQILVDNVLIVDDNGKILLKENFDHLDNFWIYFLTLQAKFLLVKFLIRDLKIFLKKIPGNLKK
jgi:hypothetical protein